MRKIILIFLPLIACLLCSCQQGAAGEEKESPASYFQPMEDPAAGPAGEPNLFVSESGTVYLSWIQYLNDTTDALMYATLSEGRWSAPRQIAQGTDWFVNWADFPSLAVYPGGGEKLAAHWLAKSAGGTYDYDVVISQCGAGGQRWSEPFILHTDGVPAEHGFVTLLPLSPDRMMAVWLDGRHTKAGEPEAGGHGHGGAMTLRTATFDPAGNLYDQAELDHRVCDCCQTDAALTSRGPVVVYRDRSEEEMRDIFVTRRIDGEWTTPQPVFSDNWRIAGCPVNGPAIDAVEETVAVAWFSDAAEAGAQVKVAFSRDAGATFSTPVRLDGGKPAGRVDVVLLEPRLALVTWLENLDRGAEIRAVKVTPGGTQGEPATLVETSESRRSGFPILTKSGEDLLLAWTKVDSTGATSVEVALCPKNSF
jgi:hypothetical protein